MINLNRSDSGNRKYVLVEMADYFDTVLKPRIQKVAYAADWKEGKPVPGSPGQSHLFHYIRLESYEDSLDNLRFRPLGEAAQDALTPCPTISCATCSTSRRGQPQPARHDAVR